MCIEYPISYKPDDVVQTGASQEGRAGVPSNPVTISISKVSYKYQVVLPAVMRNLCDLTVDILHSGKVEVEGIVSAGEVTSTVVPTIINRRARRIFPQGHFTINFTLPGPPAPNLAKAKLHPNGVLEGVVLKAESVKAHKNDYQPESSDELDMISL